MKSQYNKCEIKHSSIFEPPVSNMGDFYLLKILLYASAFRAYFIGFLKKAEVCKDEWHDYPMSELSVM